MSHNQGRTATLTLAALGVVYGDIGTSPLYTMKEIFDGGHHPVPITPDNILGMLSLIFWSLMIVVSLKYVLFIMRADNHGEGGIMALMAQVRHALPEARITGPLMFLGLFGAALFYGDSVLTPAISVLSAVEGLEIAAPGLQTYVIPIALTILLGLFVMQKYGTAKVGTLFGPVIVIWFVVLGGLGIQHILATPAVLSALNPMHAAMFFVKQPLLGFFSLAAAVLALTGGEALYADMGHFGRKPVQIGWFGIVLPGLVLNYFGQGALLMQTPAAIRNPFYLMAPDWALIPMVVLATLATVIASQAVISGAYSVTQQAIQLGYLPRMNIQHTSHHEKGQVYVAGINWSLLVAVAVLVIGFGSSSSLAAAYGIAVTGTMAITTILAAIVVRKLWGWPRWLAILVAGSFLLVDLAYFSANLTKLFLGGWFPLALATLLFIMMTTWFKGRALLNYHRENDTMPLDVFVESIGGAAPTVPGTAVFLTSNPDRTPHALLHSLKHYKSIHERVVILTVDTLDNPYVPMQDRVSVKQLNDHFWQVTVHFGFMDQPLLPDTLQETTKHGLELDEMDTSFFLGRETLVKQVGMGWSGWRAKMFMTMFKNAGSAASYFGLPPNRVVELGSQIVL
ncbi:potassium transporter Kup [Leeia oryzae]|uniref:potassium transporter Kup n=1 Tax=Leeia oryzae TaxID=356662 RepID=UPI00036E560A|nr:potassium transporter Kup [Leeia oryzae]